MKRIFLYICLGISLNLCSFLYSNDLEKEKLLAQLRAFRPELQPNEAQLRSMIQALSRRPLAPHEIRELEQLLKQKAPVGFEKYWEKLNRLPGRFDPLRLNHSNSTMPVTQYNRQALTPAEPTVLNPVLEDFQVNENVGRCDHYDPQIAMNRDGNYVVVWTDARNGDADIFAQRYDRGGEKQGSSFRINDDRGSADQSDPVIAVDGSGNFVVVWQDERNGYPDIYGQRYNSSGAELGNNFRVNDDLGSSDQEYPEIAVDGNGNFVVVWQDGRNGKSDIYGQRYSSRGFKQDTNFLVNDDRGNSWLYSSAIAMDGNGNFVVVWCNFLEGFPAIYGQQYSSSGIKQGVNFFVSGNGTREPALAVDDSGNFIIVWADYSSGADIYGQRYSSCGVKQGSLLVTVDHGSSGQNEPAIAVDSSGNFVVVWSDSRNGNRDIYGQQYSSRGVKQGTNFLVTNDGARSNEGSPEIVVDGDGNFVVVWEDSRSVYGCRYYRFEERYRYGDIYGQQYNSRGVKQGVNFLINDTSGSSGQRYPAIAVDSSGNFVVVWDDERNGNSDIYGQRYSSRGVNQGANFLVNDDRKSSWQFSPAIAVDGNGNFVVVWEDTRNSWDIYGQRYSSRGIKQDTNFLINDDRRSSGQYSPAITMDGSGNFVVVWGDERNDWNGDIYGQRYNSRGVNQEVNFLVNADLGHSGQYSPAIAVDGSGNFVVVWSDERNEMWYTNIYGQRYSRRGVKLGADFLVNDDRGRANQLSPAIAVDGSGNFVVVWYDERNGNWDIYGQRYNSSGSKQGNNFLVNNNRGTVEPDELAISVDDDGNFIIVWTDLRNGNEDIYAQLYNNTGQKAGANYRVNNDNTTKAQNSPAVKFENNRLYYCWTDNRVPGQGFDIFARIDQSPFTSSILPDKDVTPAGPVEFKLNQNYPNPFNPETTIRYFLPMEAKVSLTIFDVNGREMIRLFEGNQMAGEYAFTWNGCDRQRLEVPSGVYLCQLRAGALVEVRKMALIK